MATQNANPDAKFIKFHSRKFIKCKNILDEMSVCMLYYQSC